MQRLHGFGVVLQGNGDRGPRNFIEGQGPSGAGLVIVDAPVHGPQATDNLVKRNLFKAKTLDILVTSGGPNNVIVHNRCTTSDPVGLCG